MLRSVEALSPQQARVLGCLIEKEATTPDAYPLTMNALLLACNQTSNRTPFVNYDETTVTAALDELRAGRLARVVHSAHGSRVPKYRHALPEVWAITPAELAVLAVMLLRGPQTVNELRTRTERYAADLEELGGVDGVLDRLATRDDPVVVCLGRQVGQREERWTHLLAGPPTATIVSTTAAVRPAGGRLDDMEEALGELRREVDVLRRQVDHLLGRD
jgi:uncharacterized protein YceH (UPF0502 family)